PATGSGCRPSSFLSASLSVALVAASALGPCPPGFCEPAACSEPVRESSPTPVAGTGVPPPVGRWLVACGTGVAVEVCGADGCGRVGEVCGVPAELEGAVAWT